MKNIFRTFLSFLTIGFMMISCSDAIDIVQEGEASEEVMFKNLDDLQNGLNSVYLVYNPGANDNGQGDAILFNDLFTDNLKTGSSNSGHGIQMYQHNLQSGSYTPESIWGNRYATINYANRVLRAANNIEATLEASEINRFNNIKAQLYAMRAIAHYDIFMYFTPDYKNSSDLSAIIMDYVPNITDKPVRNTVAQVVEFIFSDLDLAEEMLTSDLVSPFYINIDVINAFRAKLALAIGDYPKAGLLAQNLVVKYSLANRAEYTDLFQDKGHKELIFGLLRVKGNSKVAGNWYANKTAIDGSPLFEMSRQLYNLFESGDVRIDTNVLLDETSDPSANILLINKYPGSEEQLLNHLKIVRASEMVLILAEVQARNSQLTTAASTLRSLTDARYSGPGTSPAITFTSVNEALAKILVERRKELCFEGHRFLDLKRIGKEIGVGVDRLGADAASFSNTAPTILLPTDYRFTLPIPQAEINANRNAEQNPNYTNN